MIMYLVKAYKFIAVSFYFSKSYKLEWEEYAYSEEEKDKLIAAAKKERLFYTYKKLETKDVLMILTNTSDET